MRWGNKRRVHGDGAVACTTPFPARPPVLPNPAGAHLPGGSGRLAAKQNAGTNPFPARPPVLPNPAGAHHPVGAAAWPRSRLHGPTPSRRGRRSHQNQKRRTTPVGAAARPRSRMHWPHPIPAGPPVPPKPAGAHPPGGSGRLAAKGLAGAWPGHIGNKASDGPRLRLISTRRIKKGISLAR